MGRARSVKFLWYVQNPGMWDSLMIFNMNANGIPLVRVVFLIFFNGFGLWVLYSGTTLVQRIIGFTPVLLSSRRRLFSFASAALAMPVRSPADVLCIMARTQCWVQDVALRHSFTQPLCWPRERFLSGTPLIWVQILGVTDIFWLESHLSSLCFTPELRRAVFSLIRVGGITNLLGCSEHWISA